MPTIARKRKPKPKPNQKWPVVSDRAEVQRFYEQMRRRGQSHNIAESCALRNPPGTKNTDRAFLEGTHLDNGLEGMPRPMAEMFLREAHAAGVVTTGKVWKGTLGGHTNPLAWVSSLGDVKRVCEEKNWSCPEAGVTAHEEPPEAPVALAEDIVQEEMADRIERDPSLAKDLGELRDAVIEQHGYKG